MIQYSIRPLQIADIPEYLALTQYIDGETDFLGSAPTDSRPSTLQLISSLKAERQVIFVAANEQGLIGHIGAFWRRGTGLRVKHTLNLGLGIAKDFWGMGIGNALMEALEQWALEHQIHRLELEVMTHNKAAIALYQKRGFEIEGTKRCSIIIKDEFIDEYLMSKLLTL